MTCFYMLPSPIFPDLYEASIVELQHGLEDGLFTSVDLVMAYLARIEEVNYQGPSIRAVLETNPSAIQNAQILDFERLLYGARGPLHGIPILLKDNIATVAEEGMNTTAGSFALLGSVVHDDAHVTRRLRQAGAIVLGKTSMSEWAHFRGDLPPGWCARGGQGTSPYVPLGDPSGSSSGSAVASAIGLSAAALGTETTGSITLPCNNQNLVGMKPTVGFTSRTGVIPISSHQDSVGPMTRTVTDAAIILNAIVGRDPLDNYTLAQPPTVPDFTAALDRDGLKGVRLGVPRNLVERADPFIVATFNASLDIFRALGAIIMDPADIPSLSEMDVSKNESIVLQTDFKIEVGRYLDGLLHIPTKVRTLAGIIAFNQEHADEELVPPYWTDQSELVASERSAINQTYFDAIAYDRDLGATRGIDGALKAHNISALIAPSIVATDHTGISGYPIITVPLGFLPPSTPLDPAEPTRAKGPNMPFGLAFVGTAWSDCDLIKYAYAYEQATRVRLRQRAMPEAIPKTQLPDVVSIPL
ncbi:amidase signature enzyme [Epithele typhae]|uniref:amidase signature enzyme n=1 Tax=Epithele typhae TaxID=378194 RepID=UPI002008BB14|nr:amidase signature enzyme [Epithele typhae]KAH9925052.1 amidase signature enzyme [Epithele typhae]